YPIFFLLYQCAATTLIYTLSLHDALPILFLTYHFIGIFAKNSAEEGTISPVLAAWMSTLIMLPLGIFFTYRATTDQGLLTFSNIIEPFKRGLKKFSLIRKETK